MIRAYSVLDFAHPGAAAPLAAAVERWGYRRLWFGEHHSGAQCSNPLLLGLLLAAATRRLRIGTGGASLAYWNAVRLAEDARFVEFMQPGRFDLGVTRGLSPPGAMDQALRQAAPAGRDDYHERLALLHGLVTGRVAAEHPLADGGWSRATGPPMWVLGLSRASAGLAGRLGTGFCFSLSHAPGHTQPGTITAHYRAEFRASPEFPEPAVIVVVRFVCAATQHEADRLAATAEFPEAATGAIIGTPADCVTRCGEIARAMGADEVMLIDFVRVSQAERREMYRLVAAAAGIGGEGG